MKKLLFVIAAIIITASINAQDKTTRSGGTKFSIGVNAGLPTAADYKFAFGGDLQVDIPAGNNFNITGSAGYEVFHWKVSSGTTSFSGNTNFIPVLAGAKLMFGTNWYAHAQLGYSFSAAKASTLMGGGEGAFTYAPGLGWNKGNWDVSVKYFALSPGGATLGAVLARFAYTLGK